MNHMPHADMSCLHKAYGVSHDGTSVENQMLITHGKQALRDALCWAHHADACRFAAIHSEVMLWRSKPA